MDIKDVKVEDVLSVYSGKANSCCCGCSGKHTYNPDYKDAGTINRGYEVDDDECSLRTVKLILNKCKKNGAKYEGDYFFFETKGIDRPYYRAGRIGAKRPVAGRLYMVYLKPSDEELAKKKKDQEKRQAKFAKEEKERELGKLQGAGI